MAARTVRAGFLVYTGEDGRPATGYLGDEVDVHEDDLERFDRLNPEEVAAAVEEESSDEPDEPSFSQADVDAAVKDAEEAKDVELAEVRQKVIDEAQKVAEEKAALATEREQFEQDKAALEAAKAETEKAAAKTPAKTAGK